MRTLFAFIARYATFFLFLLLEGISFFLIYSNSYYHRNILLRSSNALTGSFYESVSRAEDYFRLKAVNDSLRIENGQLRKRIQRLKIQKEQNTLNQEFEEFLIKEVATRQITADSQINYHYIPAQVVNKTVVRPNNYLTLNKGRMDGIKPKMGVVSLNGVVGIVKNVSDHFATVYSVLHKEIRISAKVERANYFGSVQWTGMDPRYVTLQDIPKQADINPNTPVVTTGYSSLFPPDTRIGRIQDATLKEGTGFYDVTVRLSTNFRTLEYVYVVDYFYQNEKQRLEEQVYGE